MRTKWVSLHVVRTRLAIWFAHRMPRWLVYWCGVRMISHATTGQYSNTEVPALTAMEALRRWR